MSEPIQSIPQVSVWKCDQFSVWAYRLPNTDLSKQNSVWKLNGNKNKLTNQNSDWPSIQSQMSNDTHDWNKAYQAVIDKNNGETIKRISTDSQTERHSLPLAFLKCCETFSVCLKTLLCTILAGTLILAIVFPILFLVIKNTTTIKSTSTTMTTTTSRTVTTATTTSATITTTTSTATTTTTSTTTTTTETTTIACAFTTLGLLQSFGLAAPLVWTQYSYSYVAVSASNILRFSSATDNSNKDWYIDSVTIINPNNPSVNLIRNGNFENGSSVGWELYSCSSTCIATIQSSPNCLNAAGSCYNNNCSPSANIQFLQQSFNTIAGVTYNVTFWVLKGGSGIGPGINLYVNII